MLQLQLSEDDENAYRVETSGMRWLDMINVGAAGTLSGAGSLWNIPIQIRTDPKKVALDAASFDIEVATVDGWTMPVGSLVLGGGSDRWRLSAFGGAEGDAATGPEAPA